MQWKCASSHPKLLKKAVILTFPSLRKVLGDLSHSVRCLDPVLETSQAVTTLRGEAPRPYGEEERGSGVPESQFWVQMTQCPSTICLQAHEKP